MLKSLELVGFKSFAEKTRLEFPAGVTAVVGPNGSGKSNVVDAVKWVLGSQSPRTLRGKEMTDVIFNGSESRGPANCAEATLSFDNRIHPDSDRRLFDLDENEVRLTRRVHRSGEGEYLVNGRTCRLKDFRTLLAGTGVGAESYSIIEQGRVDAALRASPLERRLLLEEAAGVSRFRLKKREAAKRLEVVEQNLLRLSDIVDEVEGRLRRVRSQAGKARRYREATLRLKEARTQIAADEWHRAADERERLTTEQKNYEQRAEQLKAEIADQEAVLAKYRDTSQDDANLDRELQEARKRASRCERDLAIATRELQQVTAASGNAKAELAAALREELAAGVSIAAQDAITAAEATAAEYAQSVEEVRSAISVTTEQLASARAHDQRVANRRSRIDPLIQRGSAIRTSLGLRLETLAKTQQESAAELAEIQKRQGETRQALAEAASQRNQAADTIVALDKKQTEVQRALDQLRKDSKAQQKRLGELREQLAEFRARVRALQEERERFERLNADIRSAIDASAPATGEPLQVIGLVADLIHVDADFVPLVEAALGDRVERVVVDRREALLNALHRVSAEAFSQRVAFEPMDANAPRTAADQIDLSAEAGVLGRAEEFIEVEPRHAPLIRRLLTRIWFVDTLATAQRLSESIGRGLTFVTLQGETLAADQSVSSGAIGSGSTVIGRREDLQLQQRRMAELELQVNASTERVAKIEENTSAAEQQLVALQEQANEQRARLAAAAQHAATLDERLRQIESACQRLVEQQAGRGAQVKRSGDRLAGIESRLSQLHEASHDATTQQQPSASGVRELEAKLTSLQARLNELVVAADRHQELLGSLRAEARVRPDQTKASDSATRQQELANFEQQVLLGQLQVLRFRNAWSADLLRVQRLADEATDARAARHASEQVRLEIVATVAQGRSEIDELARRSSEAELRRQRVEMEAQAAAQRVRDDYGVEVAALSKDSLQSLDAEARRNLREEIDRLRGEVQSIGAVNTESLEELDELEDRFTKLSGQYEDLSQAKKSLARLTTRINSESRELFLATYETVREHFRELFSRLFGGGEADLLLVDPAGSDEAADPLDGGLEIVACPPGKELRNLSLLSGGEKTMTCVALLLALFRSRPSPFCLLDEVDAALDEANVSRFCDVLKDFLGSTQFIVVTHSRRTMAGADTLYGITMQEAGISKQISVRVEEVAADGTLRMSGAQNGPIRRAA